MANTSPKAERPAKNRDATSSAKLVHQERVNRVIVSLFDDDRCTIQREYRQPDGKRGYANSLRPNDWSDARNALAEMEDWHALEMPSSGSSDDA